MTKLLITGGAGFIGTHLTAQAMARGLRVRILDNLSPQIHGGSPCFEVPPGAEFIRGDVRSRHDLESALAGIDTVVHLAAETGTGQSMYEIDRYYSVNAQGTALLCDILANGRHDVRKLILASSRSVYGEGAYLCFTCDGEGARRFPRGRTAEQLARGQWDPVCPICASAMRCTATREDDALSPASIYAASKLAQEELVRITCAAFGISFATLRFQNVFGEGQSLTNPYTGILSIFSTRIRLGLPLPIFEDGLETRDFVHVEDVAKAIISCMQDQVNNIVANVGLGQPTSIMQMARSLVEAMGGRIEPHVTGQYRIGDIRHNYAAIDQLKDVINYRPQVSFEEGLERFCRWVSTQPIPDDLLEKANAELAARKLMC